MRRGLRFKALAGRIALLSAIASAGLTIPSCKKESQPPSAGGPLGKLIDALAGVEELTCVRSFVFANLSWRSTVPYDEIRIHRGDDLVGVVPGNVARFTDLLLKKGEPICGYYEYEVYGIRDGEVSESAFVRLSVGSITWNPNSERDLAGYRISFSIAPLDAVFDRSPNPYHAVLDHVTAGGLSLSTLFRTEEFRENLERIYGISSRVDLAGDTFEEKLEAFLEGGQIYLSVSAVDKAGNVSSPSVCRPFRYRIEASDFSVTL